MNQVPSTPGTPFSAPHEPGPGQSGYPPISHGVTPPQPQPPGTAYPPAHDPAPQPPAAYYPAPPPAARPIGAWVLLAAGVAAIAASFLSWASVTAPFIGTISVSGVDGSDGAITIGAGLLLTVFGAVGVHTRRLPTALVVFGVLGGLMLSGMATWKISDVQSSAAELRAQMGPSPDDPFGIAEAFSSAIMVRVGPGLWLLLVAGVAAVAGAIVAAVARR